jgi:hypothetical protein
MNKETLALQRRYNAIMRDLRMIEAQLAAGADPEIFGVAYRQLSAARRRVLLQLKARKQLSRESITAGFPILQGRQLAFPFLGPLWP